MIMKFQKKGFGSTIVFLKKDIQNIKNIILAFRILSFVLVRLVEFI